MVAIRGAREVDNTTQFKLFTRSDFLEALARERNNCGSFKIRYAVSPTSYEIFKNTLARAYFPTSPSLQSNQLSGWFQTTFPLK